MNTITLNGTGRLPAGRPGARRPTGKPTLARVALEATAVVSVPFVVALMAVTLRMLLTAHMVPGFHDALARTMPFLG